MSEESLKSIRGGMVAALALLIVWALAFPLTVAELQRRQAAEDLTAWLVLMGKFMDGYTDQPNLQTFHERFVASGPPNGEAIDSEMKDPPLDHADLRPGGDNSQTAQDLTLLVHWPGEKSEIHLMLETQMVDGPYEVFEVKSDARFLPFDRYDVVIDRSAGCRDCIEILSHEGWVAQPRLLQTVFNTQNQPRNWEQIRSCLWPGATETPSAASLHQGDTVVAGFIQDALSTNHTVWGVSIDAGLFFVAPGILLGAQAFLLLGPILVLMGSSDFQPREPWIMTIATRTPRRHALEVLLLTMSTVWCLAPIAVGLAQIAADVALHPLEHACYWLGAVGLLLSTAINAVILYQLRRVRLTRKP